MRTYVDISLSLYIFISNMIQYIYIYAYIYIYIYTYIYIYIVWSGSSGTPGKTLLFKRVYLLEVCLAKDRVQKPHEIHVELCFLLYRVQFAMKNYRFCYN